MSASSATVVRYFALQVAARSEGRYLRSASAILARYPEVRLFWPRRDLRIRQRGRWREVEQAIFPGYLFLEAREVPEALAHELRRLRGFRRFLRSNDDIQPVSEADARPLTQLLRYGEVVRKSVAVFDENNRIRIIEGPLKGLEGMIVKVDRRKGRAKVKLDLYDESHLVDFGFTSLEKTSGEGGDR